jgi:hypothetical protein
MSAALHSPLAFAQFLGAQFLCAQSSEVRRQGAYTAGAKKRHCAAAPGGRPARRLSASASETTRTYTGPRPSVWNRTHSGIGEGL